MLGEVAPLKDMVRIAKQYGAMVLVDEAHSMGFIGEHGRGVAEAQGVIDDVDFIIGTFSKSVGTVGGFRSEEHTSELQSLMRISYAVFCLTKKIPYPSRPNCRSTLHTPSRYTTPPSRR